MLHLPHQYPAGAFGPSPGVVLGEPDVERLLDRARTFQSDPRKRAAYDRWRIYCEDWAYLVVGRIDWQWSDKETKAEMAKFVSGSLNVGLDVTRQVAVVYKHGARRSVEGTTDGQDDALTRVIGESWIDVHAPRWNQLAFLLGPVCVLPVIRQGRLDWEVLLPHYYDVVRNPANPRGAPLAVCYTVSSEQNPLDTTADTVIVDGVSWRYYATASGQTKLVDEVSHGAGTFPGSILSLDISYDSDWWGPPRARRLVEATVDVGVINTALSFVRKSQNHKLLVLIAEVARIAQQQKKDPEAGIVLNYTNQGGQPTLEALDFDTSPENFIQHIRFIIESAVEAYGIPAHTVTYDAGAGSAPGERLRLSHEGLTEVRNDQIPFCRRFEHELWEKTIRVLRHGRHPLAAELPDPGHVRDAFRVEFPELSRTFESPSSEIAYADHMLSRGQTSEIRMLRQRHPTLTQRQAEELQAAILDERKKFLDELASRNLPASAGKIESAAQAFGRLGPAVRDGDTPPPDDEPEGDEDQDPAPEE